MKTIIRDVLQNGPISTTEARVIQGRVGTLNTSEVEGHAPYTLRLVRVEIRQATNGSVVAETWELNQ